MPEGFAWPDERLKLSRRRASTPPTALAWALVAGDVMWGFDPQLGLVDVPLPRSDAWLTSVGHRSISEDGRRLQFVQESRHEFGVVQHALLHLATGELEEIEISPADHRSMGLPALGPDDWSLAAVPTDRRELPFQNLTMAVHFGARYLFRRDDLVTELPFTDPTGENHSGPFAQFEPQGSRVAVSTVMAPDTKQGIVVYDWHTGNVARFEGGGLAGSASWSPSGQSLLVGEVADLAPRVLDLATGNVTTLEPLAEWWREGCDALGWVDDDHVLMTEFAGRRLFVDGLDIDTGTRRPLLDLPLPAPQSGFDTMLLAPALLTESLAAFNLR